MQPQENGEYFLVIYEDKKEIEGIRCGRSAPLVIDFGESKMLFFRKVPYVIKKGSIKRPFLHTNNSLISLS